VNEVQENDHENMEHLDEGGKIKLELGFSDLPDV
jgi:hypothetical protein